MNQFQKQDIRHSPLKIRNILKIKNLLDKELLINIMLINWKIMMMFYLCIMMFSRFSNIMSKDLYFKFRELWK
jgi:hypothetical protein